MAKVSNRVTNKQVPLYRGQSKPSSPDNREMRVSVSNGFKEIREMNRKLLNNLKN
ncbi:hypothetical protein MH215_23900 [Paenibacillus sp. ACRSA]|uniref:hypothetical protein n=1 Tax=Paenibacillus sp. ACRSA TaxID=2918211 RepID=UPI001EF4B477|nr:hypothetical protein [Paenibacillus sp. ACRSA]MCG7380042.1 hypothetical protein [Paenibacillus sp. ACRSA]